MPNVPTYQRQLSIPGKTSSALADDSSVTEIGKQQSGLSKELLGLSGDILRIRRQMKEQQDETTALNISTSINDDYRTFASSEISKTGTDTYNSIDRANEFERTITEKYTKDYQNNPNVGKKIKEFIRKRSEQFKDKIYLHELDQRTEYTNSSIKRLVGSIKTDVFKGTSTFTEGIELFDEKISGLHDTGAIGKDMATELIVQGNQDITEAYIDGWTIRNPKKALEIINSGTLDKYMKQEKIEEYDKKAKTIAKDMQTLSEAAKEKAIKKADSDAAKNTVDLLRQGKPLEARQYLQENKDVIKYERYKDLYQDIDAAIKLELKEAKDGPVKTDDDTYTQLSIKIKDGVIEEGEIRKARNAGLLSIAHFESLTKEEEERKEGPSLDHYDNAVDYARAKIITEPGLMGESLKPEENQRFRMFKDAFNKIIEEKKIPKTDRQALWDEMQALLSGDRFVKTYEQKATDSMQKLMDKQKALIEGLRNIRKEEKPKGQKKETGTLPEGLTEITIEYNMKKYGKTREEVIQKWKSRGK